MKFRGILFVKWRELGAQSMDKLNQTRILDQVKFAQKIKMERLIAKRKIKFGLFVCLFEEGILKKVFF